MEILSRENALKKGLKRYFNGVPCKRGHVSERYLDGMCTTCKRESEAKRFHAKGISFRQAKASPDFITKSEAIQLGLKRYFTGIVCTQGHVSERRVSDGNCIKCESSKRQRQRDLDREGYRKRQRTWARKKRKDPNWKEKKKAQHLARYHKLRAINPEEFLAKRRYLRKKKVEQGLQ